MQNKTGQLEKTAMLTLQKLHLESFNLPSLPSLQLSHVETTVRPHPKTPCQNLQPQVCMSNVFPLRFSMVFLLKHCLNLNLDYGEPQVRPSGRTEILTISATRFCDTQLSQKFCSAGANPSGVVVTQTPKVLMFCFINMGLSENRSLLLQNVCPCDRGYFGAEHPLLAKRPFSDAM